MRFPERARNAGSLTVTALAAEGNNTVELNVFHLPEGDALLEAAAGIAVPRSQETATTPGTTIRP